MRAVVVEQAWVAVLEVLEVLESEALHSKEVPQLLEVLELRTQVVVEGHTATVLIAVVLVVLVLSL
jgi:hypothetical protein